MIFKANFGELDKQKERQPVVIVETLKESWITGMNMKQQKSRISTTKQIQQKIPNSNVQDPERKHENSSEEQKSNLIQHDEANQKDKKITNFYYEVIEKEDDIRSRSVNI